MMSSFFRSLNIFASIVVLTAAISACSDSPTGPMPTQESASEKPTFGYWACVTYGEQHCEWYPDSCADDPNYSPDCRELENPEQPSGGSGGGGGGSGGGSSGSGEPPSVAPASVDADWYAQASREEKLWCVALITDCGVVAASAKIAGDWARSQTPGLGEGDNRRDALRHTAWAALMSLNLEQGSVRALFWLNLHETSNPGTAASHVMDYHNNAVGLDVGAFGRDNPQVDLFAEILRRDQACQLSYPENGCNSD